MTRSFTLACVLATAVALVGCGEKDEPALSTTTSEEQAFEITGQWAGELSQKGLKPFAVRATIASLERFGDNTVKYGGELGCSGTWEYLGASESAYRFREVIERGAGGRCKGTGTVSLTPLDDDRLDYEFRGAGVVSSGVLNRI